MDTLRKEVECLRNELKLKDIEISNNQDKSPYVSIHKTLKDDLNCNISISHDGDYAVAFALIEK